MGVIGHLRFLSLLLLLSSQLSGCRIPSCCMDGFHVICLKNQEKSCYGASERRSSSQFSIGHVLVIQVFWSYVYRRGVDGHKLRLCWSFDYTPTRSLGFWGLLRDAESTQRSFRRGKRSTKLSFTQFAADFVQQPCEASARGCRRVGRDVQAGTSTRLMCAKLSCPQTWQCTKLFLSCSANEALI